jgi:2-methylisocitrate lyase-like PEP mutase family enzyme
MPDPALRGNHVPTKVTTGRGEGDFIETRRPVRTGHDFFPFSRRNLEDGVGHTALLEQGLMEERVRAIREMADAADIHLVINARTDVFLVSGDDTATNIEHAVVRGNAYRAAGADSIFVPDMGDMDRDTIATLVNGIDAPVNLIAGPMTPPVAELTKIGVGRLSLGPRPMRACLTLLRRISRQLQDDGSFELINDTTLTYADVQGWFEG